MHNGAGDICHFSGHGSLRSDLGLPPPGWLLLEVAGWSDECEATSCVFGLMTGEARACPWGPGPSVGGGRSAQSAEQGRRRTGGLCLNTKQQEHSPSRGSNPPCGSEPGKQLEVKLPESVELAAQSGAEPCELGRGAQGSARARPGLGGACSNLGSAGGLRDRWGHVP